jgi:hypothetical protein
MNLLSPYQGQQPQLQVMRRLSNDLTSDAFDLFVLRPYDVASRRRMSAVHGALLSLS